MKNYRKYILTLALGLCAMLLWGCSAGAPEEGGPATAATPDTAIVYTVYVGLADQDSQTALLTEAEAKEMINSILTRQSISYTVYDAYGAFPGEAGQMVENETLVYTGIRCEAEVIIELIAAIREDLNLESVYCTSQLMGYKEYR